MGHIVVKDERNKLQMEKDNLNDVVCSSNDTSSQQLKNIEFLEKKLDEFDAKNKDLEAKITKLTNKDMENTLRINTLTTSQNESYKIISEYETLLKDLKTQLI